MNGKHRINSKYSRMYVISLLPSHEFFISSVGKASRYTLAVSNWRHSGISATGSRCNPLMTLDIEDDEQGASISAVDVNVHKTLSVFKRLVERKQFAGAFARQSE